jgi:very-short-patch-repair endonuclease
MAPNQEQVRRARDLRRNSTPAEVILWRELRGRRFAGFKFRRQRPVGPFVADFFCHGCGLIVELDGESHVGNEASDQSRQTTLEGWGYKVMRFWNPDVYDDLESVLEAIYQECVRRTRKPPNNAE